jgi:hypothetical protein
VRALRFHDSARRPGRFAGRAYQRRGTIVKEWKTKRFELGPSGDVTLHISEDAKRLLIEFATDPRGFDKSGLNGFIDALRKARDRMER